MRNLFYLGCKITYPFNASKIKEGKVKAASPVGNLENYEFDRQECLEYVNQLGSEDVLNFSALAKKFNLHHTTGTTVPKNGGQVLKQFLLENNCDLTRFGLDFKCRIRKKKRRYNYISFVSIYYFVV